MRNQGVIFYGQTRLTHKVDPTTAFRRFCAARGISANQALWEAYLRWKKSTLNDDFARFYETYSSERNAAKAAVEAWPSPFVNAKKGEPYKISFRLPDQVVKFNFVGLERLGLALQRDEADPRCCVISGIPTQSGSYELPLLYIWRGWLQREKFLQRKFSLLINPDPKELWENIPSDQTAEYARPDLAFEKLVCGPALLWGASRRGRSHAHEGKPRDDSFALACYNDWKMIAVADGAGSAEFSRKGAEIACSASLEACQAALAENAELERIFQELEVNQDPATWKGAARKLAYHILPGAAFAAHKAIRREAESAARDMRSYATTLLLAIARKFPAGWAILSFQVGDGAMGMFTDGNVELLAQPDEGEYSGQTRFITMNEIFDSSQELMRRLRIDFVPDLRGLLLMTDGVSDAWFQTDAGLADSGLWKKLWEELLAVLTGTDPEAGILDWLNFWSRGNHDDRTAAIMAVEK